MNDLMRIDTLTLTMNSVEIADLTGKQHKDVLRDIRLMLVNLGYTAAQFCAVYKDQQLIERPCFNLPKRETLVLVTGYDVRMRAAVIDRWQVLEEKETRRPDPMAALSDPVQLRALLLSHVEQNIALKQTVALQAPKVMAFDRIKLADGLVGVRDAAKTLGISEKLVLVPWLLRHKWMYRVGGAGKLKGYAEMTMAGAGYVDHKLVTKETEQGEREYVNAFITPKGMNKLAQIFAQKTLDLENAA